ncbi:sulfatase-like hydrolase/transferase [Paenibacillus sp. HB172176]|uniref:sulfatase family protein n=1 Tax=Paenibacillus sp. HB172176 TaxID=2493690 RepID=UPI001439EFAE|nr:sulfatase-like hydrolase/transferase [Paenibacillus sp. HB172176]
MKNGKKNVVVIMTDQQRSDVRALEGYPLDTTPFLDSLAQNGTWFDKAYTTMPICGPARTSLLTGCWPSAHRVSGNFCLDQAVYEKDLFDVAKEQGYATALIGKNHSYLRPEQKTDFCLEQGHWGGFGPQRTDEEKAYDGWLKTLSQVSMEATPFPLHCQLPYRAVSAAQSWIREQREQQEQQREQPFMMWLSFPEPHNPYQAPEPYYSMFDPEELPPLRAKEDERDRKGEKWKFYGDQIEHFLPDYKERIPRARSNYLGMLRLIDDQIRRFVQFLEDEALLENTLIVFVSDHGDFVGEYELIKKGPEAPDILTRIPLQFYGPGVAASASPHPAHVSLADIMPTVCEAMGSPIPASVQGRSLWPILAGGDYPEREFQSVFAEHGYGGLYHVNGDEPQFDLVGKVTNGVALFNELNRYTQSGWLRTVRKGDWKLNLDMHGRGELYQIARDPLELNNLFGQEASRDVEREMLAELCTWMIRVQAPTLPEGKEYPLKRDFRNYWFSTKPELR